MIVTYRVKYRDYQRSIRNKQNKQIERAEHIIKKGASAATRNLNTPLRFIEEVSMTRDGKIAEKKIRSASSEKIRREMTYDGFYAVYTTLEDDAKTILRVNKYRWRIEDAFRTIKKEFRARPANLQLGNRLEAHFHTCFIALMVLRTLEDRLKYKFPTEEVIHTLRDMQLHKVDGYGYLSSYKRTDLTDQLHEVFGFNTDTEFISNKTMKKIVKEVKKNKKHRVFYG